MSVMTVYMATNRDNGMRYTGVTKQPLRMRMTQHLSHARAGTNSPFHAAIIKHGFQAFDWRVLAQCDDRDLLLLAEREAIDKYKTTMTGGGYNATAGGAGVAGFVFSDTSKAKISAAHKGRIKSDETRRRLSVALKGRKPSPQTLAAVVGVPKSREHCENISKAKAGKPGRQPSDETVAKLKAAWVRRHATGCKLVKIPDAAHAEILQRRVDGHTFVAIAKTYGCAPSAVHAFLARRAA